MNNINKTFVYFICIVSAMGGLLFGYDWVVIGGAKPFYELLRSSNSGPWFVSFEPMFSSFELVFRTFEYKFKTTEHRFLWVKR